MTNLLAATAPDSFDRLDLPHPVEPVALRPLCPRAATSGIKRMGDMIAAAMLLAFLAPFLLLIACVIRMSGPGPVFFRQQRTGMGGKVFRILKFRTMRVIEDGPDLAHARRVDARTTRIGAVLRRSSLDELPQLLNILVGDMSFVGPRPHAIGHDRFYGDRLPGYGLRFCARPGLTGLAQVRGLRGEITGLAGMAARISADRDYITRWSLARDLVIIVRTVPRILHDRAAF